VGVAAVVSIIKQQQDLEYFPDELLINEVSAPSGRFPPYLVITELERRQEFRDRFKASQQAKEGEQPTIAERRVDEYASGSTGQGVDEYTTGIVSADPNFQNQDSSLMTETPQGTARMAGGGKVPRYQAGGGKLFVNPMTNSPYTREDIALMQSQLSEQGSKGLAAIRGGAYAPKGAPGTLSEREIQQVIQQWSLGRPAGSALKDWGRQFITPNQPLAGAENVAARKHVLREQFSALPGAPLPHFLRDPNLYAKYMSLGQDSAAFMDWAANDPSELAQQARTYIETNLGMEAADLGTPSGLLPIDPASAAAKRARRALEGVTEVDEVAPDATGIQSLTDYGGELARLVTGDDEGLGSLLRRGQPSTDLTSDEKAAYAASKKAVEATVGTASLPAGVLSEEWYNEQTKLLAREAFDDTEFADYLEGVPGNIEEMRAGLESRIRSQLETRGGRDEDMKKALKDALISGDEVDRRSNSMLLITLGRAVMKIGIDSVGASEILAQGTSDIWDYKRSTKIENLDIQKSLNEIASKADSDELRLHEAMVSNNTAEISDIIGANQALLTGRQADDALRNSITTGIEQARVADQNAIRGREVDIAEAKAAVAQLLVAKATLTRSLIDKGHEYYAKTFTAIVNAWSAMYSSVSTENAQERNRLQRVKLGIDILETELAHVLGDAKKANILSRMQALFSQLGLGTIAPNSANGNLAGGADL
jgi:hypothetical protein